MHVLITTGLYPPESGGPATYTKLLEERLPAHDFSVSVIPFRTVRHLPPGIRHIAYFLKVLFAQADVVYAQDTVSVGLPSFIAALVSGKKFVVRVPGDYAWEQARQRYGVGDELDLFQYKRYGFRVELLRKIQKFVVRRATKVIVPSKYMQHIVSLWGVMPELLYNGIDLHIKTKAIKRPEGFLIVSFGRQVPWKGFDALRRIVEPGWHLKIFNNLPRTEAMGWLKAADVYVNNSTYEGLSHQVLEAMALGTPIIATNVGGNPELIDNKTGILIEAKNDKALHQALREVASNMEAARARAEQARFKVQEFSIDVSMQKLAKVLRTI